MKTLTDEQRKFAEENHSLIYKFLHSRNLSVEEYYDICAIGYVQAVANFDPNVAKFSTYAYHCMNMEVGNELRKLRHKGRHQTLLQASLDKMIDFGNCESGNMYAFIEDISNSSWEDAVCDKIVMDSLRDIDKRVISLKLSGMTQQEIGKEVGCSQAQIARIIKKCREMII